MALEGGAGIGNKLVAFPSSLHPYRSASLTSFTC